MVETNHRPPYRSVTGVIAVTERKEPMMSFSVLCCSPEATKQTVLSIFSTARRFPWRGSHICRGSCGMAPSSLPIPVEMAEEHAPPKCLAQPEGRPKFSLGIGPSMGDSLSLRESGCPPAPYLAPRVTAAVDSGHPTGYGTDAWFAGSLKSIASGGGTPVTLTANNSGR
jgi:hypothetical protein